MKKTVNVYVMRHGQKQSGVDNDQATLTELGRKQVMDSAAKNLAGITFDALYCSLKFRALETVVCATSVLPEKNFGLSVIAKDAFDYSSMPQAYEYNELAAKVAELAKERNQLITVALWEEVAPIMIRHLIKKMYYGILDACWEVAEQMTAGQMEFNVLVGCHSPSSELATLDPENTTLLREADIFCYKVELEGSGDGAGGKAQIVESRLIDRGF